MLSNDVHPDGGGLYIPPVPSLAPTANGGTVTIHPDGAFVYTPKANFVGTDTFTYTVMDLQGRSTTGTVSITVAAKPDAPVAEPDAYETDEDAPLTVDASDGVLGNDSDLDGDAMSVQDPGSPITTALGGTVTINADGSFTYAPKADVDGVDTFSYTLVDGTGLTATATATITVAAKPDAPVAEPDSYQTDEDTPLSVDASDGVLGNDSDVDGDTLSVRDPGTAITTALGGTVTINADGSFTYAPKADVSGVDTFSYTVVDSSGLTSTGTVTITVVAEPDAPVTEPDSYQTAEDTPVVLDVLANDTDADDNTLAIDSFTQPLHGSVALTADGKLRYTPEADWSGVVTFSYTAADPAGNTSTTDVSVEVVAANDDPDAFDDSYAVDEDGVLTVDTRGDGVLANDTDTDTEHQTLTVKDPGSYITAGGGTVSIAEDGTFTYTPKTDFDGTDTFTYTVIDGAGGEATAMVHITVNPLPDVLVADDDSYSATEDTTLTVDAEHGVLSNDSRGEGASLSVVNPGTITTSTGGTVTLNADGSFTYHPVTNWYGTDSFTYTVTDGIDTATATVSFEIASVNDIPVANDDAYQVNEDNFLSVVLPNQVVGNDSDGDGDIITVKNPGTYTTAEGGTVTIVARGTFIYTPKANWSGEDSFTYTATDGNGGEATATVRITVVAINDAPKANPDNVSVDEDTAIAIDVVGNDTDVEGDTITIHSYSQPTHGTVTLTGDGKLLYTPKANWSGTETFTYTATDGTTTGDQATVTVTVDPVPDAPVIIRTEQSAPDPKTGVITGRIVAVDPDQGTTLQYGGTYTTDNLSTFVVHEDGTFTYTPSLIDRLAEQPFTFGYTVGDGGLTASGTVSVTNTAPDTSSATQPRVTITYVSPWIVMGHVEGVTDDFLIAGWGTGDPSYLVIDENGDFIADISRTERYAAYQAAKSGQATTLQFLSGGSAANQTLYSIVVPVVPQDAGTHEVTVDEERWGNTTTGHIDGVASQYQESPGGSTLVIAPGGDFYFTPSAADQYAASLPGGPATIRFDTNNASNEDNAPIVLEVEPNADYPYTMTVDYGSSFLGYVDGQLDNHSNGYYGTVTDTGTTLIVEVDGGFTVHFSDVDRYAAQQSGVATYMTFFVPVGDGTKRPVVVRVPLPGENSSL